MDLDRIKELLRIVAESGVSEVEIEDGDLRLIVRKNAPSVTVQPHQAAYPFGWPPMAPMAQAPYPYPAPAAPNPAPAAAPEPPAPVAAARPAGVEVRAPIVGTFYRSPAPDAEPYVSVGDRVKPGDVLCIIEAMKLMNEVECEMSGTVLEVLVENSQPVEFDQPLFVVDPD
jgi:acetyl-CoA carboxylase biotin carboxyl carrier protein